MYGALTVLLNDTVCTVKPVYNNHLWEMVIPVTVERWPL